MRIKILDLKDYELLTNIWILHFQLSHHDFRVLILTHTRVQEIEFKQSIRIKLELIN